MDSLIDAGVEAKCAKSVAFRLGFKRHRVIELRRCEVWRARAVEYQARLDMTGEYSDALVCRQDAYADRRADFIACQGAVRFDLQ